VRRAEVPEASAPEPLPPIIWLQLNRDPVIEIVGVTASARSGRAYDATAVATRSAPAASWNVEAGSVAGGRGGHWCRSPGWGGARMSTHVTNDQPNSISISATP
jgi:hypothetical protein